MRPASRPKVAAQSPSLAFDSAYYRRFYLTPATRAVSREQTELRARLIGALVRHLDIPVRRILDVGCGLGWYRKPLLQAFRGAEYVGTELSAYLCRKKGWIHGSITDIVLHGRFDLVICADVLQYLDNRAAQRAIRRLAAWCRGALYFHAPTAHDWRENIDPRGTDTNVHIRSATWYRQRLREYFIHVGCGVHVKDTVPFAQWELEEPWR